MYTTSSQTIGPYLHIGMTWAVNPQFAGPDVEGERIEVSGRIVDGDGKPVTDAMIEIWQANAAGRYAHADDDRDLPLDASFTGWGRVITDDDGRFGFATVKPGPVPSPDGGVQAPHLNVTIFMRGLLKHLWTRIYFDGETANARDPVLARVGPARSGTLIAKRTPNGFVWNVVLQGADETVFFDV
ncbi:MAG TPA: protocatechuate 3,4-dioxygenase subunit alpha [Casimicrobiaceae bacterium]|nr:protocatechuate 3,4-dioxygenase subunit alpha [Casimicrobiaceae bacterium]